MSLSSRRRRKQHDPAELNITAFLNLMVILVPFLLITAVFSRMTILELNIPPAPPANAQQNKDKKKEFNLVVTIRSDSIDVGDTIGGLIKSIRKTSKGHNYLAVTKLLEQIKGRYPDKTTASILSEPDISYEILVQVMDTVRVTTIVEAGEAIKVEMFPDISIGDAPAREAG